MFLAESERVLTLLEEIETLQNEMEEGLSKSNEQVSSDVIKFQDLKKNVEKYVGILRDLSVDMVNICERLNSLNARLLALQSPKS